MADKPPTTIELSWERGFKFKSTDGYDHTVTVDAPMNEGDGFDGMMPAGLLLTSLAGCSGIDVVNILLKQRQKVTGFDVRVTGAQQPDPPWIMDEIKLEYTITGKNLKQSAIERAIELSEEKYCFVGATLGGRSNITSTYKIIEEK